MTDKRRYLDENGLAEYHEALMGDMGWETVHVVVTPVSPFVSAENSGDLRLSAKKSGPVIVIPWFSPYKIYTPTTVNASPFFGNNLFKIEIEEVDNFNVAVEPNLKTTEGSVGNLSISSMTTSSSDGSSTTTHYISTTDAVSANSMFRIQCPGFIAFAS